MTDMMDKRASAVSSEVYVLRGTAKGKLVVHTSKYKPKVAFGLWQRSDNVDGQLLKTLYYELRFAKRHFRQRGTLVPPPLLHF